MTNAAEPHACLSKLHDWFRNLSPFSQLQCLEGRLHSLWWEGQGCPFSHWPCIASARTDFHGQFVVDVHPRVRQVCRQNPGHRVHARADECGIRDLRHERQGAFRWGPETAWWAGNEYFHECMSCYFELLLLASSDSEISQIWYRCFMHVSKILWAGQQYAKNQYHIYICHILTKNEYEARPS